MVSNGFPNVATSGQQNIGEKLRYTVHLLIRSRNCVPVAFTAESLPAQGLLKEDIISNGWCLIRLIREPINVRPSLPIRKIVETPPRLKYKYYMTALPSAFVRCRQAWGAAVAEASKDKASEEFSQRVESALRETFRQLSGGGSGDGGKGDGAGTTSACLRRRSPLPKVPGRARGALIPRACSIPPRPCICWPRPLQLPTPADSTGRPGSSEVTS